jgi:hypothetical protein
MWAEIEKHLPQFETAVLNTRDAEGYPYSIRCHPEQDHPAEILWLDLAEGVNVRPGPASLLCHSHDERLWNQKIFLLKGWLEETPEGHAFRPEKFIPSIGIGGPVSMLRTIIGARKSAAAYLEKRGLERPSIPWAEVEAVKEEA